MATRKASKACLDFFVKEMPELIGGSADLTPSNNTFSASSSTFSNENPSGNHINYGVREFGMSAIMNGMVLHGGIKAIWSNLSCIHRLLPEMPLGFLHLWAYQIYLFTPMTQ